MPTPERITARQPIRMRSTDQGRSSVLWLAFLLLALLGGLPLVFLRAHPERI
jgi:hypothetical protein